MAELVRGRLLDPWDRPADGERLQELARIRNVVVDQILSGRVETPVDYLQDHDELVVVLAGAAVLELGGQRVELGSGDWVLLPAREPHRLLEVTPGTSWLAVHVGAP